MRRVIVRFLVSLLAIFIASLVVSSCKQISRTPRSRVQTENPVFAEWRDMRARRTPEGTKLHWRIYVNIVSSDEFYGYLENNWDYPVFCRKSLAPESADTIAEGDWLEVVGRYAGVDSDGRVKLYLEELTNLGPRY